LKKILGFLLVKFVWRPGQWAVNFIFYKIIVKFYILYLALLKKMGWQGFRHNLFSFLLYQKLVHLLVVFITVLLVAINLTAKTKAHELAEQANQTILSQLIKSEFGELEEEQLILETFDKESVVSVIEQSYLDNLSSFRPSPR